MALMLWLRVHMKLSKSRPGPRAAAAAAPACAQRVCGRPVGGLRTCCVDATVNMDLFDLVPVMLSVYCRSALPAVAGPGGRGGRVFAHGGGFELLNCNCSSRRGGQARLWA